MQAALLPTLSERKPGMGNQESIPAGDGQNQSIEEEWDGINIRGGVESLTNPAAGQRGSRNVDRAAAAQPTSDIGVRRNNETATTSPNMAQRSHDSANLSPQIPTATRLSRTFHRDRSPPRTSRWSPSPRRASLIEGDYWSPRSDHWREQRRGYDSYKPSYSSTPSDMPDSFKAPLSTGPSIAKNPMRKRSVPDIAEPERVNFSGLKAVPKGPKSATKTLNLPNVDNAIRAAPHAFIPGTSLPPHPATVQHLQASIKGSGLQSVHVDSMGYYIVFPDTAAGHASLKFYIITSYGRKLFNQYILEPVAYHYGQQLYDQGNISRQQPRRDNVETAAQPSKRLPQNDGEECGALPVASALQEEPTSVAPGGHEAGVEHAQNNNVGHYSPQHALLRNDKEDASSVVSEKTATSSNISASKRQCHVCKTSSSLEVDALVHCSSCPRRYHRRCHGSPPIPTLTGTSWRCRRCVQKQNEPLSGIEPPNKRVRTEEPTQTGRDGLPPDALFATSPERLGGEYLAYNPNRKANTRTPGSEGAPYLDSRQRQTPRKEWATLRKSPLSNVDDSHFNDAAELVEKGSTAPEKSESTQSETMNKLTKSNLTQTRIATAEQTGSQHKQTRSRDGGPSTTSTGGNTLLGLEVRSESIITPQSPSAEAPISGHMLPQSPIKWAAALELEARLTSKSQPVSSPTMPQSTGEVPNSSRLQAALTPEPLNHTAEAIAESDAILEIPESPAETRNDPQPERTDSVDATVQSDQGTIRTEKPKLTAKRTNTGVVRCRGCRKMGVWTNAGCPYCKSAGIGSETAHGGPADVAASASSPTVEKSEQPTAAPFVQEAEHGAKLQPFNVPDTQEPNRNDEPSLWENRTGSKSPSAEGMPDIIYEPAAGPAISDEAREPQSPRASDLRKAEMTPAGAPELEMQSRSSDSELSDPPSTPKQDRELSDGKRHRRRAGGVDLGNSYTRPKNTYVKLICLALCEKSPLQHRGICSWIAENIPGYELGAGIWENGLSATICYHSNENGKKLWIPQDWKEGESKEYGKGQWLRLRPRVAKTHPRWDPVLKTLVPAPRRSRSQRIVTERNAAVDEHVELPASARKNSAAQIKSKKTREDFAVSVGSNVRHRPDVGGSTLSDHMDIDSTPSPEDNVSKHKAISARRHSELEEQRPHLLSHTFQQPNGMSLAHFVKSDNENRVYSTKSLFEEWPEYDPKNAVDRRAKIEEIRSRPNRKQIFGKPAIYSRLGSDIPTEALKGPKQASLKTPPLMKRNSRPLDDKFARLFVPEENTTFCDTLEAFLDLPRNPISILHQGELAYRDGTKDERGDLPRAKVIYKAGPS